jgi:hypothetical protein
LLKLVAFIVRRRIWADNQVVRLWGMFVLHFSVVAEIHKAGERGIS